MASTHVTEFLSAYLDNALDAATASRVKTHLRTCPECRNEERLLAVSWSLLGSLEPVQPSPDFRARFWEKVRAEEDKKRSWLSWPRLVPAFAGIVGVWLTGVGLGLYFFMQEPPVPARRADLLSPWARAYDVSSLGAAYLKRLPEERS
jgi:anti-sigma factor RsiW